jgi:hypothetical protein
MAGIEHDERTSITIGFRRRLARFDRCGLRGTVSERHAAHEAGAICRNKIEDQPRRLALCRIEHEGSVETHWSLGVEHDARAALHDQAKTKCLHQTAALLAGFGRKFEARLGQIDHHPVGVRECEDSEIDLSIQVDHEAGLLVVTADAYIVGHHGRITLRRERARNRGGLGDDEACLTECYANQPVQYCNRTGCHESRPF